MPFLLELSHDEERCMTFHSDARDKSGFAHPAGFQGLLEGSKEEDRDGCVWCQYTSVQDAGPGRTSRQPGLGIYTRIVYLGSESWA